MNRYVLEDRDDGKSFNVHSKGNYYSIIEPYELYGTDDILIVTPKVDNSINSISFEQFKSHILDNLENSMIYAITKTQSLIEDYLNIRPNNTYKKLFITAHEICTEEDYNAIMTTPRRVVISKVILTDDVECVIEICSKPSRDYSSSIREYDCYDQ